MPMSNLQDRLQASVGAAYRIRRELGRGGMATVFLAHDVKHRRDVALNVEPAVRTSRRPGAVSARDRDCGATHAPAHCSYLRFGRGRRISELPHAVYRASADAYNSLGFVTYCYDFDWPRAERELRRSIELLPNSPTARHWLGMLLVTAGRSAEAVERLRHAQQLEPLSLPTLWGAAWVDHYSGDYERAADHCRKVLEMAPYFTKARLQLGQALCALRRHEEAIAELQRAATVDVRNSRSLFPLGYAYGSAGRHDDARSVLRELHELARDEYVFPDYIAFVHAGLGANEAALEWLERAYDDRSSRMIVLAVDPMFAALRGEPRFERLLARLKLLV